MKSTQVSFGQRMSQSESNGVGEDAPHVFIPLGSSVVHDQNWEAILVMD